DEGVVKCAELEEFIKLGMLDGVAMTPARGGGLTEARRQIEMLEKYNLMFLGSGLPDPDVSLAASVLLYGAYGLKYPAALNGPQFLEGSVLKRGMEVKEGMVELPRGVGLGVEVDEARMERLRVKV
ncbi:MAG: mandelate racemase, partial [Planctomycetota bacterium]|nr:mandelate racemase [Planctomycetota bacterium]